jgi:hypothetical protein
VLSRAVFNLMLITNRLITLVSFSFLNFSTGFLDSKAVVFYDVVVIVCLTNKYRGLYIMRNVLHVATYLPRKAVELINNKIVQPCKNLWRGSEPQDETDKDEFEDCLDDSIPSAENGGGIELTMFDSSVKAEDEDEFEDCIDNPDAFKSSFNPNSHTPQSEEISFDGIWSQGEKVFRPFLNSAWPQVTRGWWKFFHFSYDAFLNSVNSIKSAGSLIVPWTVITLILNEELTDSPIFLVAVYGLAGMNFFTGELRYLFSKFENSHTDNVLEWQELTGGLLSLLSPFLFLNPDFLLPIIVISLVLSTAKYCNPDFLGNRSASGHNFAHTGARPKEKDEDTSSAYIQYLKMGIRVPAVFSELITPQVAAHFTIFSILFLWIYPAFLAWGAGAVFGLVAEIFRISDYFLSVKYDFSEIKNKKRYRASRFESSFIAGLTIAIQAFFFMRNIGTLTGKRYAYFDQLSELQNSIISLVEEVFVLSFTLVIAACSLKDIVEIFNQSFGNRSLRLDNLNPTKEDALPAAEEKDKPEKVESSLFNGEEKVEKDRGCLSIFFDFFRPQTLEPSRAQDLSYS